jgi:N-acetylglutamate synthase-like GNAT family acetyltransferase
MTTLRVDIIPFEDHHQADIDLLMTMIAKEFADTIFSPQSKTIKEVSLLPTDKYWVALRDDKVIGTIGLATLKNNSIALKRMFLSQGFRGQGIAKTLLDTIIKWAADNGVENIYLGTMTQFKAAQIFYERNGFREIIQTALPIDFPANPVDKVFYKGTIK